jgi:hypothetical protein
VKDYFLTAEASHDGKTYSGIHPAVSYSSYSAELLNEYFKVYQDGYVRHLRRLFDAFLSGEAVSSKEIQLLKPYDKDYFESRFIVASAQTDIMGGMFIKILFQNRPDVLFNAWVYPLESGKFELRSFEPDPMEPRELWRTRKLFKEFLEDKEHCL